MNDPYTMRGVSLHCGITLCACGCGVTFHPTEDIRQKYLNHRHARHAYNKRHLSRVNSDARTTRLKAIQAIPMINLEGMP